MDMKMMIVIFRGGEREETFTETRSANAYSAAGVNCMSLTPHRKILKILKRLWLIESLRFLIIIRKLRTRSVESYVYIFSSDSKFHFRRVEGRCTEKKISGINGTFRFDFKKCKIHFYVCSKEKKRVRYTFI